MLLEITNLKAKYGNHEVLRGINLNVNAGEIIALLGSNGSGKSTLLKSIFRQVDFCEGKIVFNNKKISNFSPHKLIGLGIGFLPQGSQIFPNMTILENLLLGIYTINNKYETTQTINNILKTFPFLEDNLNKKAGVLSGGQQQLLGIARVLLSRPNLLLLDEPTMGLSTIANNKLYKILTKLKRSGTTIIISEQNKEFATTIADKVYIIEKGLLKS